ncbi:MAG: hydroxypyruvate isomerase family protein [Acidimicrobiia bacterium]
MPRFAANVSFLWPTIADPYERFALAAAAGFDAVELTFVHDLDIGAVAALLRRHELELVLFDPYPGDWAGGERGVLCLPGRGDEARWSIRRAVDDAARTGTKRLNVLAGIPDPDREHRVALHTAARRLKGEAPYAADRGIELLVENINPIDMPGYLIERVSDAAELVALVDEPNVRLQFDAYHVAMVGEDPVVEFGRYASLVSHIQIADVPGRHQPGTGIVDWRSFLKTVDGAGYAGAVALEYHPRGSMDEALAWLVDYRL